MTREEAIDYFEQLLKRFEKMREEESSYWGKFHTGTTINAIAAALSALRAPVQEHGHWTMVSNGSGVCSVCNRLDKIDPLAAYCKYCGAKLKEDKS